MKNIALALFVAISAPAFATGTQASGTNGQQQQVTTTSDSVSGANNAGNSQSIVFTSPGTSTATVNQNLAGDTTSRVVYSGTQTVKNVPSVGAPPLVSSNDTCMGSLSGSLNVAGFGGSLGSTYKDVNCVMLKNARELWNMGMRGAALARMCMDGENKEALEMTGFECPQTTRDKTRAVEAAKDEHPEVTDPLVRERMGLKPLAVAAK
jgi:hypothetical protein